MDASVGSGDRGMTSLLGGERVHKSSARIACCGEIDELCSVLGACASAVETGELREEIHAVQGMLLRAGALVSVKAGSPTLAALRRVGPEELHSLERSLGRIESELPTLQSFVIPGGHPSAAWAHVARAVCRRAERGVAALLRDPDDPGTDPSAAEALSGVLSYLNRLSTWLFALARLCNARNGVAERVWRE